MPKSKSSTSLRNKASVENEENEDNMTPSVEKVLKMPRVDDLAMCMADGEEKERVKEGDCVFVVHEGMQAGERHSDGHKYWKIKITSIHRGAKTFWVVGFWFYSPSNVKELKLNRREAGFIRSMGNTELIESDHIGVIDAACIEDKISIRIFDDTTVIGKHIPKGSWFTRLRLTFEGGKPKLLNVNMHCVCKTVYSPNLDRQRYCIHCEMWYDEECMTKIGYPRKLKGSNAIDILKQVPIIRGAGGASECEENWITVGTGRKLKALETKEKKTKILGMDMEEQWEQWKAHLTTEFVEYVQDTKFIRYACPKCSQSI